MTYCRTCSNYDMMGFGYACPCIHINGVCQTMETSDQTPIGEGEVIPVRSQGIYENGYWSKKSMIDCSTPVLTRQEYKDEADLNILLARFGVNTPVRPGGIYGEVDYTLDLTLAFGAIEAARRANLQVPPELRDKYPNWRDVLNGAESGEYQKDLMELAKAKADAAAEAQQVPKTDTPTSV